ncbi:MAG: Fic family protein [Candidatus Gracilibacteria bacterium]|nr:Fic family protein [Candidatus Gracilibacteria bacterium]MDD2908499.1 Fic family protein [Candidatus Gracilibacteria bacterium]
MKEKILESIIYAMNHYLEESLGRVSLDKHEQMKKMFFMHMEQITNYCINKYINKGELSEEFIKGLHKIIYPPDYRQYITNNKGKQVLYMQPGIYKTINNSIFNYVLNKEVDFIKPELVNIKMKQLLINFNENIKLEEDKYDVILNFLLDFGKIHPFGDGNGRIITILIDLFLIQFNLEPLNITQLKEKDMKGFYYSIQKSRIERDLFYLKEFIRNVSRNN